MHWRPVQGPHRNYGTLLHRVGQCFYTPPAGAQCLIQLCSLPPYVGNQQCGTVAPQAVLKHVCELAGAIGHVLPGTTTDGCCSQHHLRPNGSHHMWLSTSWVTCVYLRKEICCMQWGGVYPARCARQHQVVKQDLKMRGASIAANELTPWSTAHALWCLPGHLRLAHSFRVSMPALAAPSSC